MIYCQLLGQINPYIDERTSKTTRISTKKILKNQYVEQAKTHQPRTLASGGHEIITSSEGGFQGCALTSAFWSMGIQIKKNPSLDQKKPFRVDNSDMLKHCSKSAQLHLTNAPWKLLPCSAPVLPFIGDQKKP